MDQDLAFAERELDRFRTELFEFLRIRSVSASAEYQDEIRGAAGWLSERLADAGLDARVMETEGNPVVVGTWRGAGSEAPTVLIYGHYDVQPAEPLDEWSSPPFSPEVRDGRIYARGAADDKGQLYMHVKALEAVLQGGGELPVNVVVLAEGEEEVGSPNLVPFVQEHADLLAADVTVISDSAMFAPGLPSLLFSLRGLAYLELYVRTATSDLHSGSYGGAVPNPALVLSRLLAGLHDDDGRIAIEGFYDSVVTWDDETRALVEALPFDEEEFRRSAGAPVISGEEGYSTLERLWARPSCDVNGLLAGYTGEGAKTVLPARAMAKVSFRLVPDQTPGEVAELFRAHVARHLPPGIEAHVRELHGGAPWRADPRGWAFEAAERALEESFGTAPVRVGEGGSIPIVSDFQRELRTPVLLVGFALPGANMHAPDEWFPVENFETGIGSLIRLFHHLRSSWEDRDRSGR
jgi:acetylornithine deacetylase/succinyl-diaminopimelate desuccinylase-like protein